MVAALRTGVLAPTPPRPGQRRPSMAVCSCKACLDTVTGSHGARQHLWSCAEAGVAESRAFLKQRPGRETCTCLKGENFHHLGKVPGLYLPHVPSLVSLMQKEPAQRPPWRKSTGLLCVQQRGPWRCSRCCSPRPLLQTGSWGAWSCSSRGSAGSDVVCSRGLGWTGSLWTRGAPSPISMFCERKY